MSAFRKHRRDRGYTAIDNSPLLNPALSLQAKGLLAVMMSRPDDWKFYMAWLERQSKNGREAHKNAMAELLEHHYVVRVERREGGKFDYEYLVSDLPIIEPSTPSAQEDVLVTQSDRNGFSVDGLTAAAEPLRSNRSGKPATNKTYSTNTDSVVGGGAHEKKVLAAFELTAEAPKVHAAARIILESHADVFGLLVDLKEKSSADAVTFRTWVPHVELHLRQFGSEAVTAALENALESDNLTSPWKVYKAVATGTAKKPEGFFDRPGGPSPGARRSRRRDEQGETERPKTAAERVFEDLERDLEADGTLNLYRGVGAS